jgi:hypothetical protein
LASESPTGNEFDRSERERIRWALIDYMKAHRIGVPTLASRIKASHPREMEIPWKTLQRFLGRLKPLPEDATADEIERAKPRRTHDIALTICAAFVEKLPSRKNPFELLGEAAHAIYYVDIAHDLLDTDTYTIPHKDDVVSDFTIVTTCNRYALAIGRSETPYRTIYDGVMFSTKKHLYTLIMKDRLTIEPRVYMLVENYLQPDGPRFKIFLIDPENGFTLHG